MVASVCICRGNVLGAFWVSSVVLSFLGEYWLSLLSRAVWLVVVVVLRMLEGVLGVTARSGSFRLFTILVN